MAMHEVGQERKMVYTFTILLCVSSYFYTWYGYMLSLYYIWSYELTIVMLLHHTLFILCQLYYCNEYFVTQSLQCSTTRGGDHSDSHKSCGAKLHHPHLHCHQKQPHGQLHLQMDAQ